MTPSPATTRSTLLATLRRWAGRVLGNGARSHDALELQGMSDHELKDLGIGRSEVQEWSRRRVPDTRPGTPEPAQADRAARLQSPRRRWASVRAASTSSPRNHAIARFLWVRSCHTSL